MKWLLHVSWRLRCVSGLSGRRGMHKNPVQSSLSPTRHPAPHNGDDPGAMNLVSLNTFSTDPFTVILKSPPTKSTSKKLHVRVKALEARSGSITFLGDHVV